ncbi:VOC family protein [Amycolatopsis samaneae]|uniref:VOC family protein n=1 Tax=Amycolatopsis samaneae TaxID=664691 RepID=A0ABW5GJT1_9PSEU
MGQPVVHFEIIGSDPGKLRNYYGALFDWEFDTSGQAAEGVSEPGEYGFVEHDGTGVGIPGGVAGGEGFESKVLVYVAVEDVEVALRKAESLGGKRVLGPARAPGGTLVVGHFTDPAGNLVGVAALAN